MVTRSVGRMGVGASLVVAVAAWFVACSDGSTGPGSGPTPAPNRPPLAIGTIPAQEISLGDTVRVHVARSFADPDGDALSYAVRSSAPQIVGASASGSSVALAGFARGSATITVTASDPLGLAASHAFEVTVPNSAPVSAAELADRELRLGTEADVDVSAALDGATCGRSSATLRRDPSPAARRKRALPSRGSTCWSAPDFPARKTGPADSPCAARPTWAWTAPLTTR